MITSPFGPNAISSGATGTVVPFWNNTGSTIPKGSILVIDTTGDFYMRPCSASNAVDPYVTQGVAAAATANGTWGACIQTGMAEVLVNDNVPVSRGQWMRTSITQDGRARFQDAPGFDFRPTTFTANAAATTGGGTSRYNLLSGNVTDLYNNDTNKVTIAELTGANAVYWEINFANVTQTPLQLKAVGYTTGTNDVNVLVWDYNAAGWVQAITFPANGTSDETYTFTSVTANMVSSQTMHVLVQHPDIGNINDRFYLNELLFQITADTEHFKEVGHSLQSKAGGTDQLVWVSIHLL